MSSGYMKRPIRKSSQLGEIRIQLGLDTSATAQMMTRIVHREPLFQFS